MSQCRTFFPFYFYVFSVQDFTDVFQVYPDNQWFIFLFCLCQIKCVLPVTGPKILSRVHTHFLFKFIFLFWKCI